MTNKIRKNSLQTEKSLHLALIQALNNSIYRLVLHGWRAYSVLNKHYRSSPCFNSPSPPWNRGYFFFFEKYVFTTI